LLLRLLELGERLFLMSLLFLLLLHSFSIAFLCYGLFLCCGCFVSSERKSIKWYGASAKAFMVLASYRLCACISANASAIAFVRSIAPDAAPAITPAPIGADAEQAFGVVCRAVGVEAMHLQAALYAMPSSSGAAPTAFIEAELALEQREKEGESNGGGGPSSEAQVVLGSALSSPSTGLQLDRDGLELVGPAGCGAGGARAGAGGSSLVPSVIDVE
jgi:hypothetical protein